MTKRLSVPLAWKNLTHNRVRMSLFCAGIGFAVVLMFLQLGCYNALLDSSVLLIDRLRAPLVLVSKQQTTILLHSPIARDQLIRATGVAGVASTHPVYLEYATTILRNANPEERERDPAQSIRVIGVDPTAYLLNFPQLDPNNPESRTYHLELQGRVLFDRRSKHKSGAPQGTTVYGRLEEGTQTELSSQRIVVVGLFELGVDFGTDGTLIVSTNTFRQIVRPGLYGPSMDDVDIGLVRLHPEADVRQVQRDLQQLFGDGIDVLTKEEFMEREKGFWRRNTPIGAVFGFGMFMGFLVGLVICYQILSTDIRDNLSAYATLRAIGYPNAYLTRIVFEESVLLAVLGFIPGVLFSWGMYEFLADWSDLPLRLTPLRLSFIFALTLLMCVISGILAVRQAMQADPAEVF